MLIVLVCLALIMAIAGCGAQTAQTNSKGDQSNAQASQAQNNSEKAASVSTAKPKNGTKFVIGVSLPSPDNQWVAAVIDNANTQAKMDGEKYEFMITTANNPAKQVADIEDMLIKKPDAMVIFPIESAPVTPIAEQVKKNGIPLLVLTRGIESENYDAYIRGDDRAVGIAAAHYIGERLDGKGNIVMMQAAPLFMKTFCASENSAPIVLEVAYFCRNCWNFVVAFSQISPEKSVQYTPLIPPYCFIISRPPGSALIRAL
jgi:ribose transport system substrate-binding protein